MNSTINDMKPPVQKPGFRPSTCSDLATIGYRVNGIFPVLGIKSQAVEMAFCDFSNPTNGKNL